MTPKAREIVTKVILEADNLIRIRLLTAGIAVPHITIALAPGGDTIVAGNCRPDMVMAIANRSSRGRGAGSGSVPEEATLGTTARTLLPSEHHWSKTPHQASSMWIYPHTQIVVRGVT